MLQKLGEGKGCTITAFILHLHVVREDTRDVDEEEDISKENEVSPINCMESNTENNSV